MKRSDILDIVAKLRDGAPAITGPGGSSGGLWTAGHQPATIYYMEMGCATAVCHGVAWAKPDLKVLAVEGDGAALMGLSTLATVGRYQPKNLIVLVLENGVYGTGGGTVPTAAAEAVDLAAVAVACGFPPACVKSVSSVDEAEPALRSAFAEDGPWFIRATVEATDTMSGHRPLPQIDFVQAAYMFTDALAASTPSK